MAAHPAGRGTCSQPCAAANGTDWTEIGSTSLALGSPILVGAGVASHRKRLLRHRPHSASFRISRVVNRPTISGLTYNGTIFTGSIQRKPVSRLRDPV